MASIKVVIEDKQAERLAKILDGNHDLHFEHKTKDGKPIVELHVEGEWY